MRLSVRRGPGWGTALFALVIAAYGLVGWRAVLAHTDPTEMDTAAYLDAALQIRQTGGILNHLPNLIRGVYTEATQHPLYLLLLSPIAENDVRAFIAAKCVSYAVGFVFLVVFFVAVRRLFGTGTAGMAGWLWLMSAGFVTLMTTVACEGLLGVFVIAFWWAISAGRNDRRLWVAAGALAALAYLTKSIGILLLPVFTLTVLWWERGNLKKLFKSRAFWGFFGIFALVALPLFIRNAVVYGTPLYSDSSGVLWIDRWSEFSYERAAEGRFTLANYLNTHSPQDMFRTLWEGLTRRTAMMVGDGLKPLPFWRAIEPRMLSGFYARTAAWQGLWALALMLLAGTGWWTNRRHAAAAPTFFLVVIFWVFVGWFSKIFPGVPPTRLLYPVLILVPVYAALGLRAVAQSLWRRPDADQPSWPAAVALVCFCAGLAVHSGSWIGSDIRRSYAFPPLFSLQLAWSRSVPGPRDRIVVGDMFLNHSFYFKNTASNRYVAFPKLDSMEELVAWVRREKINYLFVDLATALYNQKVFGEHYRVERPGVLKALKPLPPVFQAIPKDPRIPPMFDLYAVRTEVAG